jgi:hypothetical protein
MKKKNRRYTTEQIEFLRAGYLSMHLRDLTLAFNAQFGENKTEVGIKSTLKRYRIFCGRKPEDRLRPQFIKYTNEQAQFLRDNYAGRSVVGLTAVFNDRFGTDKTTQQIKTFVSNRGITSGRTGCFEKGNKPWNTGTKGLTGANATSFKKGNVPANRKPLGSERTCSKDGYILIKIGEQDPHTGFPTRHKHKHVHIWEQANGPVPEGMIVAFRDSDKLNIEPENLMLISRAELLRLNKNGYKDAPDELKPSVLALSKLEAKTFDARTKRGLGIKG